MNEITQCALTSWPWAKWSQKGSAKNSDYDRSHTSLTADETSGRNDEQDVLRHKQTLFSSSWMPLWGSMKMTSLPREMWLPYRCLTHLAQTLLLISISSVKCPIVYRSTRKCYNVFFRRYSQFASVFTTEDGNVGRCLGTSGTRSPCAGVSERQGMRWFAIAVMCN